VGVLCTFVLVAGSLRAAVADALVRGFHGDFVVEPTSSGLTGLPATLRAELAGRAEVGAVTGLGLVWAELGGRSQALPAVVAAEAAPLFDVDVTSGDLARLDEPAGGLAVQEDRARREGWRLGEEVAVTLPVAGVVRFPVVALYRDGDLAGDVLVGRDALRTLVADAGDRAVFVELADGVSHAAGRAALTEVVAHYPTARVSDAAEYGRRQQATIDRVRGLLVALTAVGLVLALVGVASAGALGVLERRRELALLRANGASVIQLQRMLRWEAVIAALAGTATGTVLGVLAAAAILAGVAQGGFRHLTVDPVPLVAIGALTVSGSAGASLLAGRRLARLSVVDALAAP
jgi:putative ABC transport system permease protein